MAEKRKRSKYEVKKDVGFQKDMNQTVEESKKTLATGGGEPIAKGHKRTTEKRVLQPRDPETGQFDYNSSANISRKYEYHAERNGSHGGKGGGGKYKTVPYFARGLEATFATVGVKKGDVISVNAQKYISTCDLTADEFRDQLENYLEDDEGGTHLGNDINWMKLGGKNDPNRGTAQAEENREGSLDHFANAVEKRAAAYRSDPKGSKMHSLWAKDDGKAMKTFASRITGTYKKPEAPKTPAPAPETAKAPKTPKAPETPKATETPKTTKFGNVEEAKSNPGKYLSENKELVGKMISSLKAQGVEASGEQIVLAIAQSTPDELEALASEMGL